MNKTEDIAAEGRSALHEEAAHVRASGALGQSPLLIALFSYLLDHAGDARPPKEAEIALAVFTRSGEFQSSEDATVRVYMHRLRRKLEDHYARQPTPPAQQLSIPRGEYRLMLVEASPQTAPVPVPQADPIPAPRKSRRGLLAAGALAIVATAASTLWFTRPGDMEQRLDALRETAFWAPLLQSPRPTSVVIGDAYLFADSRDGSRVERLIRDPAINSREELDRVLMTNPDLMGHHFDVGVHYLPLAAAPALQKLLPVFNVEREDWRVPRTLAMSETTPDRIKLSNIIYIGPFSAMGTLRRTLLQANSMASRLLSADGFDPRDSAEGSAQSAHDTAPPDYAYLAALPGPNGNRIVIIAGARDAGILQAAEIASSPALLEPVLRRARGLAAFEALFRVTSIETTNVGAQLIAVRSLDPEVLWTKPAGGTRPRTGP